MAGTRRLPHEALSNREIEVMKQIVSGVPLLKISIAFNLSTNTVTTYRRRILDKLNLASNTSLARYAMENKLFP